MRWLALLLWVGVATPAFTEARPEPDAASTATGRRPARPLHVKAQATVSSDTIYLGDLITLDDPAAQAELAQVVLGPAPMVGATQVIPKAVLQAALKRANVDAKLALPLKVRVKRGLKRLSPAEVQAQAEAAILAVLGDDGEARLTWPTVPALELPPGARLQVNAEADARSPELFRVHLTVQDGAQELSHRRLDVRVERLVTVLTVTRLVGRDEVLSEADLTAVQVAYKDSREALTTPADALGAKARRALSPGQPLKRAWILRPQWVVRQTPVRVIARRGGLEIALSGLALQSGASGDTVMVQNLDTQKRLQGRVIAPQTVEVEL